MRYKLLIAYDGTHYKGWQVQKNGPTIQKTLQTALETILNHPIALTGASRTDTGVHASAQVAHFDTEKSLSSSRFCIGLSALLPPDIRPFLLTEVPPTFHARHHVLRKIYRYYFRQRSVIDPFRRLYEMTLFHSCDFVAIKEALPFLEGTHDFRSFVYRAHEGCAAQNAIRTLYRAELIISDEKCYFEFEGNGFLHKMARNLVGLLFAVGAHKFSPYDVPKILGYKDRRYAPQTAPAHGLFLEKIFYPEDF